MFLFFSFLLSKWAENRSIRCVKSKISSWASYFSKRSHQKIMFAKTDVFAVKKKDQKGTKRSNSPKTDLFANQGVGNIKGKLIN